MLYFITAHRLPTETLKIIQSKNFNIIGQIAKPQRILTKKATRYVSINSR